MADSDGHLSLFQVACREGTARPFFVSFFDENVNIIKRQIDYVILILKLYFLFRIISAIVK